MSWLLAWIIATSIGAQDVETLLVPVSADTWVSNVGPEVNGNNGASPRLKLKSHQEMSLIDIDVEAIAPRLKGRVIRSVTLCLRSAGRPHLQRVSVGGSYAFREGTGVGYEPQAGSSTFQMLAHLEQPWPSINPRLELGRTDVASVLFGPQGALWKSADATPPDAQGWQRIAVDPRVFAARLHGLIGSFVVFDDTGTEWVRDGESFQRSVFPNRFVYSREQNKASAPYFIVEIGNEDRQPPEIPSDLRFENGPSWLPSGDAIISWTTPVDRGPSGTLGFLVDGGISEAARYRIPIAGQPGERVTWQFALAGLDPKNRATTIQVRAVDLAGNISASSMLEVPRTRHQTISLPPRPKPSAGEVGQGPRLGGVQIAVIDELDKISPVSGRRIPEQSETYLHTNHLWSASSNTIRLNAAKGEAVAFQVLMQGKSRPISASLKFDNAGIAHVEMGQYVCVDSKDGPLPDPIVPLTDATVAWPEAHRSGSLHVELQVPTDAPAGPHHGVLSLKAGREELKIEVELEIWNFALPDRLSFLPEMNCYGLPENERDYYRLAHKHRTYINRVPYSQRGEISPGCAPAWNGKTLDWTAWDERFGPYFDGSAFADLPRKSVPIEAFFLPLHENWPTPVASHYNDGYWADRSFSEAHRRAFVEVSRQFAQHVRAKGWGDTKFACFFNGKNDFKDRGWSRGSSPWLLDEPANFQDFWALRYFGQLFHEGINAAPAGKGQLVFRCDISRPQWQRDLLDDVLDVNVVGSAFRTYRPIVLERKARLDQLVIEYGSNNPIETSNIQPAAWCVDVWSLGGDGVLPWQTIGNANSWSQADELSLFYPGRDDPTPVPSIRLKAYRRGQQDVEYLELYAQSLGEPRWAIAQAVRESLSIAGTRRATGFDGEDAGRIDYGALKPSDLWALRTRIGATISKNPPDPRNRTKGWSPPKRQPSPLSRRFIGPA